MGHFGTQPSGHDGQTVRPFLLGHLADLGGNSTLGRVSHCLAPLIFGGRESGVGSYLDINRSG